MFRHYCHFDFTLSRYRAAIPLIFVIAYLFTSRTLLILRAAAATPLRRQPLYAIVSYLLLICLFICLIVSSLITLILMRSPSL